MSCFDTFRFATMILLILVAIGGVIATREWLKISAAYGDLAAGWIKLREENRALQKLYADYYARGGK